MRKILKNKVIFGHDKLFFCILRSNIHRMKFWKITLLTSLVFAAVITATVYSSCVKDACDNVTCYNGGSCGNGICKCPTGYEGPQCQTLSITRYLGTYGGFTSCNNTQQVIDSAFITADGEAKNTVAVQMNSISPKILHGYVNSNQSTYSIIVTNNDSSLLGSIFYEKIYTITLQSDNKLTIYSYEDNIFPTASGPDTITNKCTFVGFKD